MQANHAKAILVKAILVKAMLVKAMLVKRPKKTFDAEAL